MKKLNSRKIFFIGLVLVLCAVRFAFALKQLGVSNILIVSEKGSEVKRARIIISDFLVIENISVYYDGTIEFPFYKSKKGYEYEQLDILDEGFEKEIIKAIKTGKETINEEIKNPSYTFSPFQRLPNSGKRIGNIRVIFDDKIAVVLGVIKTEKGKLMVSWPSMHDKNGEFHQVIYVLKKKLKEAIEEAILEKVM
jgi:DNA-binding cell septation regulator SpoVG